MWHCQPSATTRRPTGEQRGAEIQDPAQFCGTVPAECV
jgi:hypothetical protein